MTFLLKVNADLQKPKTLVQTLARMDGLKRGINAYGLYFKGQAMEYAPQPADVDYIRKGMAGGLKSKWTSKTSANGMAVTIGNNQSYADEVQGSQPGKYFKRVWGKHSIKAIAKRTRPKGKSIIMTEIKRSL